MLFFSEVSYSLVGFASGCIFQKSQSRIIFLKAVKVTVQWKWQIILIFILAVQKIVKTAAEFEISLWCSQVISPEHPQLRWWSGVLWSVEPHRQGFGNPSIWDVCFREVWTTQFLGNAPPYDQQECPDAADGSSHGDHSVISLEMVLAQRTPPPWSCY